MDQQHTNNDEAREGTEERKNMEMNVFVVTLWRKDRILKSHFSSHMVGYSVVSLSPYCVFVIVISFLNHLWPVFQ